MRLLRSFFRASLALTVLVSAASCAKEGEGDRCDIRNNNDDCADNLTCIPYTQDNSGGYICCPPKSAASTDACNGISGRTSSQPDAGSDAGPGPSPTSTADAAEADAKSKDH